MLSHRPLSTVHRLTAPVFTLPRLSTRSFLHALASRWREPCGYREILIIAGPLILTSGAFSIQHFVDRMFLLWYSEAAVGASMAAGVLYFTVFSLFVGTVRYASVFVAQYFGANQCDRVGPVLWQGLYLCLVSALIMLALVPFSDAIFAAIGHEAPIQKEETIYFRILCLGAFPALLVGVLDSFYTGLGRTWPVMWISLLAVAVNVLLDWLLIFGHWGFPEMGIAGAAWGTVWASIVSCLVFLGLMAARRLDTVYHLRRGWRFDPKLLWRLVAFGVPSGAQWFIDIFGFSVFILLLGRLGKVELAASTVAFNINMLAFMPMLGAGIAVSVLVGRYQGMNRPDLAERGTYSGLHLTVAYMSAIAFSYFFLPQLYLAPFAANADPATFPEVRELSAILLRFVALYSLFDGCNIIFSSALKGAGDTRYVMVMIGIASSCLLVIPCTVAILVFGGGVYAAWTIITIYIILLGGCFYTRFRGGQWRSMRVTEEPPPPGLEGA